MADPVALTVGCFDLLHEGHANLIGRMRQVGSPLVLLHDDLSIWVNKGRMPVQPYHQRALNLTVAFDVPVLPVNDPDPSGALADVLQSVSGPHVFVRGDDWPDFPGRAALEAAEVRVLLVPYTAGVSTTARREAML